MKRDIVKDIIFLQQKAAPATFEDKAIAEDLKDTLAAHRDTCAGLAANMIGFAKAKALMLTAEKISSDEAERLGMIYKVVEDDQLQIEVVTLAEYLATQASLSFALIKQAMRVSMQNDFTSQVKVEQDLQRQAGQSADFLEGVRAFLMKDKPNFKGR